MHDDKITMAKITYIYINHYTLKDMSENLHFHLPFS